MCYYPVCVWGAKAKPFRARFSSCTLDVSSSRWSVPHCHDGHCINLIDKVMKYWNDRIKYSIISQVYLWGLQGSYSGELSLS